MILTEGEPAERGQEHCRADTHVHREGGETGCHTRVMALQDFLGGGRRGDRCRLLAGAHDRARAGSGPGGPGAPV
jgi:hypothetical protein